MFEKITSAYTRQMTRRALQSGTDRKEAGVDAQIKVIQNAKQKIIAELAGIMKNLNETHAKQGEFHIPLASHSNALFKLVRQEENGLRELERIVTTGQGSAYSRSEGGRLEFRGVDQIDKYYANLTRSLRKAAASLEQIVEKDEQYVMQHIFNIEYIRLLLLYFADLSNKEIALRNKSSRYDRQDTKEVKAERKDAEAVTSALKKEGEAAKSGQ